MKKLVNKLLASGTGLTVSSLIFATTVAAQRYDYSYDATDAAAGGIFATAGLFFYCCFLCVPLIIVIALAYWVYKDAKKYEVENAPLWALLVLFTSIIGILIYFLAIRPEAVKKFESKHGTTKPVESKPTE